MQELTLRLAIKAVGGPAKAALICSVTERAVYKWLASGSLPRTEYSGETEHAAKLAKASKGSELEFSASRLLECSKPKRAA